MRMWYVVGDGSGSSRRSSVRCLPQTVHHLHVQP